MKEKEHKAIKIVTTSERWRHKVKEPKTLWVALAVVSEGLFWVAVVIILTLGGII